MEQAAYIADAGIDPLVFLATEDPVERMTIQAVAHRVHELRAERNKGQG